MTTFHRAWQYATERIKRASVHRWLWFFVVSTGLAGCTQPGGLNLQSLTLTAANPTVSGSNPNIQPTVPSQTNVSGQPTQILVPTAVEDGPTSQVITTSAPVEPSLAVPTVVLTPPPSGNAAWEAQKVDVQQFSEPTTYAAPGTVMLWWYDPNSGQYVGLGWIRSPLIASGEFRLRWSGLAALAIPYTINVDYGLTLEPSMIQRIRRAGYGGDVIETFVYLAPDITPQ
ncbi:hypothetical protein [Herpetosiphon sp. NSE202]|uniref:hypothetical protein n=1 Tax=Herpetosiphon sp. NSE202 TaxID=3351349 RepID=UPI00363CB169